MICGNAKVGPGCQISDSAIIQPLATIYRSTIGEGSVIEEKCLIEGSTIGSDNLLEVGTVMKTCTIGNANEFHPRCKLSSCKIGSNCTIGVEVVLDNVEVPDQTSVVLVHGELKTLRSDRRGMTSLVSLYRAAIADPSAAQCLSKNHPIASKP